jgi:hypothetical protein
MRVKKVYVIIVPSMNLEFRAYNLNQLKKLISQLQYEKLRYYIREIYQ